MSCATPEDAAPTQADLKQIAGISPARDTRQVRGLDATLSTYAYPFPVRTYTTKVQQQKISIAYMDVSPEQRVPRGIVVLMHGKNVASDTWEELIRALVAEGYRVIAPDQVGFGKSSKPLGFQHSLHQLAALTRELLDERNISSVILVGHAMGGMLATRFALMYPERVSKLALINPLGLEDWQREVPYASVDDWLKRTRLRDAQGLKDDMRSAYFDGEWEARYDRLVTVQAGWSQGPDRELMAYISAQTYEMMFTQPIVYELGELMMPTQLIIGQRDRSALGRAWVSPEVSARLGDYPRLGRAAADAIPDARLVELEGLGHMPHYEDFTRCFEALRAFLDERAAEESEERAR